MKFNFYTMTAFTVMVFLTLVSIGRVGQLPACEPLAWWTPMWVFCLMAVMFLMGYLGRDCK